MIEDHRSGRKNEKHMRQGDRPRMSRGENDSHDASLEDEDDLYVGIVL